MQQHIFRNMDGMTYSEFVDVFKELVCNESSLVHDFCLDSYRFVLGEWVYHRLRDASHERFGFDRAELTTKSGWIMGVKFVVSGDIDPYSVRLEKKEPKTVYISTGGRGPGKALFDHLMGTDVNSMYPSWYSQDIDKALQIFKRNIDIHSSNKEDIMNYRIKDVIFSGPCTIVLWKDGTKTIVRCENEFFDREKGLAMAICKKVLGTNETGSNYYDIFKKWCSEEEDAPITIPEDLTKNIIAPSPLYSIAEVAEMTGLSKSTINRRCLYKDYPNAHKDNGQWKIPLSDVTNFTNGGK